MSWKNFKMRMDFTAFCEKVSSFFQGTYARLLAPIKAWLHPASASGIRRVQRLRLAGLILGIGALSYGVMLVFFDKGPQKKSLPPKPTPLSIKTATQTVDLNEVRWHTLEDENKKLSQGLSQLREEVHGFFKGNKNSAPELQNSPDLEDLQTSLQQMDKQAEDQPQGNAPLPHGEASFKDTPLYSPTLPPEKVQEAPLIHKFSLTLSDTLKRKRLKTVETAIPAGAFAKTVLLSGLDASSAMTASSDPRPMLLRVIDYGTLPRRFQSDLKDCHCTASAFGDLSSERIYARLEKLTCIERTSGEIIETQVAGYIAGSDGKAGIRGIVASKDGQFLGRSLVGGLFAGLSNVANPQNRRSMGNPFFPGGSQIASPSLGENFASGMASGASSALDRLSQYYIDRAEQLQPVIQVAAGQLVDIVFTEGTEMGSQTIKSEIEQSRTESRNNSISNDKGE